MIIHVSCYTDSDGPSLEVWALTANGKWMDFRDKHEIRVNSWATLQTCHIMFWSPSTGCIPSV